MKTLSRSIAVLFVSLALIACSDDDGADTPDAAVERPDAYIGSCQDDPVPAFGGDYQSIINSLEIAGGNEGFDLDWDGTIDNTLGPLGALANSSIDDGFSEGDIIIMFEWYGLDSATDDDCLNFGVYFGIWPPDQDEDGERSGALVRDGEDDCNDFDATLNPDASEIVGDRVDNDCNGYADETRDASDNVIPSTDATDNDQDGYTIAEGDCDDRDLTDWPDAPEWWDPALLNPGETEVCGDGLDNDCDGVADEDCDVYSTADGVDETVPIDGYSMNDAYTEANIIFRSARIESGRLITGYSSFIFSIEVDGKPLDLRITRAIMEADVILDTNGVSVENALLGGVLSGYNMDRIPNIASDFFGEENNTFLDAFVGPGGVLLALPTIGLCREREGNNEPMEPVTLCDDDALCGDETVYRCDRQIRAPDIDMDGDGIEIFLDTHMDGERDTFRVDTCIDGDGTIVKDTVDATGDVITNCTDVVDGNGDLLFQDGYSIAFRITATPTNLYGIVPREE